MGQLQRRFESLTASMPAGVWSAPGRVNLIGEHTDYNRGLVLPICIQPRIFVAAAPRVDGRLRGWSVQQEDAFEVELAELAPGRISGWAAYVCGPAWVLRELGAAFSGADLLIDSDIPSGGGLSSSAALQVAIALTLSSLAGRPLEGKKLALAAHRSETEFVGVPCGVMDQVVISLGRHGTALLLDSADLSFKFLPFEPARSGLSLLVIDTGTRRHLRQEGYAERRATCEAAAQALGLPSLREASLDLLASGPLSDPQRRRARHVVSENDRVLRVARALERSDFATIGQAFLASHRSLRDDFEVSASELDLAVEAAMEGGAMGARLTGAGFGGSVIALARTQDRDRLVSHVAAAFNSAGLVHPRIFEVAASGGARWDE